MTGEYASQGWLHCRIGEFQLRFDWQLEAGKTLVLFGPSGSGKTTALRAMAGLHRPASGHMEIDGQPVFNSDGSIWVQAHHRRVGYLTQQYHLFPHLKLSQNISYGLRAARNGKNSGRVDELVDAFQLRGLEDRYPWELSGGQQQRVALARAMATQPRLLLLDEPFSAMDLGLRRLLRQELRNTLASTRIPVVLVTHDREEALALGDEVQVIDDGRVVARGAPLDVLGQPGQAAVARLVGVENLFHMIVASRHPRDGTMRLTGEGAQAGFTLEAPLDDGPQESAGDWVTVGIRASDIILSSEEPVGSSARNRLQGTVASIEARPPGYTVELDCGVPFACHVTGASLDEMGIRTGQRLWAVFKASSCFLVHEQGADRPLSAPESDDTLPVRE